ncbi:mechanosensitive ion channel family protein [Haladaptatus salinisoli]|uniref:mechanosensitive ion channel family protein n=1 Tax=Haladaptatus salinisoli TaxID=2884876 RepID=UPI001D0A9518|nr:mechanosensitive ion channel family protein [Haladaptatus salinisoli]
MTYSPNSLARPVEQLPVPEARILLSTLLLVALVFAVWVLWRAAPRLKRRVNPRVVDVVLLTATGVAALFVGEYALTLLADSQPAVRRVDVFSRLTSTGIRIAVTFGVIAAAYISSGMLIRLVERFASGTGEITSHQTEIFSRLMEVGVYVLAGLLLLGVWNVDVRALLIGAGFLGIIIGLAANEPLSALVAGFTLMFSRPFEIGDWVQIAEDEGIVTDITLFMTRIETFSGKFVVIPNDVVGSNTIINYGRKGRLRFELEVGVDYAADLQHAVAVAERAMADQNDVLEVPQPTAVPTSFGESAVLLELRFWIDRPSSRRKWRAIAAVIGGVKAAYDREGIKIPFPQREVATREETGGFRVVDGRSADRRIE